MVDPLSLALGAYKTTGIALKAKGLVDRFGRTERFIVARDEMHREWTAETASRLADHITDSRDKFVALGGTLDDHERLLNQILDQHEVQLLAILYADASYREAIAERRRMLSFAAASLLDLSLTIEEKASVERVLRSLDPIDVLELHKLSRAVGKIERTQAGQGREYHSTDVLRCALLRASGSDDALTSARCIRETVAATGGGWGGAGTTAHEVAHVTDRGTLVLRVLRGYVAEKHDAFVGCGRERLAGSRSETEAREVLGATDGLLRGLSSAMLSVRRVDPHIRPHFEPARPALAPGQPRLDREILDPSPQVASMLRFPAVFPDDAQRVPVPSPETGLTVELADLPQYGRPATNVIVRGPYDVLRWLADDFDAHWL